MLGSDTTQILPFKAQTISLLISEQEVQAFFLKMSVDLGGMLAKSKHLDSLWQCLCSLEDRLLFQLQYWFATKRLLLFFLPGCLLWKLADVPSLVVNKSEIPIILVGWEWQQWLFLPILLKDLIVNATENKYGLLSYQTKRKNKRPKVNEESPSSQLQSICFPQQL